jgi:hypothetical protein
MSRNGAARMNSSGIFVLNSMCSSSPLHKSIAPHSSFKQFSLVSQLKEFGILNTVNGVIAKDLRLFRRDLSKLVRIDNSSHPFALQPANGLLISMWTDDYTDDTLNRDLLPFLRFCSTIPDVPMFFLPIDHVLIAPSRNESNSLVSRSDETNARVILPMRFFRLCETDRRCPNISSVT